MINGRSAVVVSGETAALDELVRAVRGARDPRPPHRRRLRVALGSGRGHRGRAAARRSPTSNPASTRTAFFSTVTGELVDTATLDADYWYRNIRQTVAVRPGRRARPAARLPRVRRVQPAPGADRGHRGHRPRLHRRRDRTRRRAVPGPRRRRPGPLPRLGRAGVHVGHPGGLARDVRRRRTWSTCPPTPSTGAGSGCPAAAAGASRRHRLRPGRRRARAARRRRRGARVRSGRADRPAGGVVAAAGWPITPSAASSCSPVRASSSWSSARATRSAARSVEELTLQAPLVVPPTGVPIRVRGRGAAEESGSARGVGLLPSRRRRSGLGAARRGRRRIRRDGRRRADLSAWPPAGAVAGRRHRRLRARWPPAATSTARPSAG